MAITAQDLDRPVPDERPSAARWRIKLFLVLAGLLAVFEALNITNLLAPWTGESLALEGLRFPDIHLWHVAVPGAVRLLMTGGVAVALLRRPQDKPLLIQWLFLYLLIVLPLVVPFALPALGYMGIPIALVVAAYPWLSQIFDLSRRVHPSLVLAGLTAIAAVLLAPDIWQNFSWQVQGLGGEHATQAHWALDSSHALVLLAGGALTSTKRPGWQPMGYVTALALAYLGFAAMATAGQPGSWGVTGGALALAGAIAFTIAVLRESRAKSPAAP